MADDDEVNWDALARMHPVIDAMQIAGVPLTRENYIKNAFPGMKPSEWTAEHEEELPAPFQGGFEASPEGEGLVRNPDVPTYDETSPRFGTRVGTGIPGTRDIPEMNPNAPRRKDQET